MPIAPPIWLVFVSTLVLPLLAVELGYRRGRFRQRRASRADEQETEAPVGATVGTTRGLLGFLLAFTFGIAADAFHDRKLAQLHEANEPAAGSTAAASPARRARK